MVRNAVGIRNSLPVRTGSKIMSAADYVQAFHDLLGDAGVVDDPQRLATYTTDQRQLFTGSTRAVLSRQRPSRSPTS
jgi:hypothetical protein